MPKVTFKKSSQAGIAAILLILTLVVVSTAVILWFQRVNKGSEEFTNKKYGYNSLPTPPEVDTWRESSLGENEVWSFKYPTDWEEVVTPGTYIYHPRELQTSQFSLSFVKNFSPDKPLDELAQQVIGNDTIIDRQELTVDGKKTVLLLHKNENAGTDHNDQPYAQSTVDILIDGVSFSKGNQSTEADKCWENGILSVHAFYRNPPSIETMPYEPDIKGILSTLSFTDCKETI